MLIENVNEPSLENANTKLIELTSAVMHQADAPFEATDGSKFRELVHIILKLKGQLEIHFPSDDDELDWTEFISRHQSTVDAIALELQSNVRTLVDFMNNNYANFSSQNEVMTRFTKLYDGVFNAYFTNEWVELTVQCKSIDWEINNLLFP